MAEQATEMVIKVNNLQCCQCYKKIKKILDEIPQVKDQTFDEKENTVKITVVCCSPEKVRQQIRCKGGKCIICIEIITPKKPPPPSPPRLPPPPPPPPTVLGLVVVCVLCRNRGCGCSCPCNCHWGRLPPCDDECGMPVHECSCGGPPMCHNGCGRPAPACRCRKPSCSSSCDASSSCTLRSCEYGRLPVCTNDGYNADTSCSLM